MVLRPAASSLAALAIAMALTQAWNRGAYGATLIYTNDVLGELEPCGCRNNPLGGLPRKGALIDQQKDPELLQLDAGDLLFETDIIPDALVPQRRLQAEHLARAHSMLGHDAVVPGEKDFALGISEFHRIRKTSGLRFLAANLLDRRGKRILETHHVFLRKDRQGRRLKIGVFGIVGDSLKLPEGLRAGPVIASAREQVQKLRSLKCDRVIALTHQGYDADVALAKAVAGIDLIVGGHTQTFLQTPVREGKTVLLQSSFRNQYVGVASLDAPVTAETHKLVALDETYEPEKNRSSTRAQKMGEAVASLKKAIAELSARQPRLVKTQSDKTAKPTASYQTFPQCAGCHLKQFDFWRKTPHAMALHGLTKAGQDRNKDCLACHSLGLGEPRGYSDSTQLASSGPSPLSNSELDTVLSSLQDASSLQDTIRLTRQQEALPIPQALARLKQAWAPVQCENCHSTAGDHPFDGSVAKSVPTTACLKCHSPERAPGWYGKEGRPDETVITAKRPRVSCPAGEPATGND